MLSNDVQIFFASCDPLLQVGGFGIKPSLLTVMKHPSGTVCLKILKVARAAYFLPGSWTLLHTELYYRLAQSKGLCLEQVYLIPDANWIHLKIQGWLVINC